MKADGPHSHKCRVLWSTCLCLWWRMAMVTRWRSSDHRSQPGCVPGYPHFQSCSQSVWLGWWRLAQHSEKHLHPPWKMEHKQKIIFDFSKKKNQPYQDQVWCMCLFVFLGKCSQCSLEIDTSQDMYILSDSQTCLAIFAQQSSAPPAKQALYQLISLILIISCSVVDGAISDCSKWEPTYCEGHKGTRLWTTAVKFVSKSGLEAYLLILCQKQFELIFYFNIEQDISWQQLTIPIV